MWLLVGHDTARKPREARSEGASVEPLLRVLGWLKPLSLALVFILPTNASRGAVLSEADLKKVEEIRPQFQNLLADLVQTSKQGDLVGGDSNCVKIVIQEMLQISGELSSYEYLMTIEKEMTNVDEDGPVRGAIRFAVEKSKSLLTIERRRLAQLSDQCQRFPLSYGKTQDALRVVDSTIAILNSIQLGP